MSVPSAIPASRRSDRERPSPAQRLALRERPSSLIVGRQRWSAMLFAHWKMAAQTVQPAWLPPLPWMSWFLELNVRTYVHDAAGQPSVWFYSLDCNQPVAVAIAGVSSTSRISTRA